MEEDVKCVIELNITQLKMISSAIEFVSRFACGQIGHSYLPYEIQDLFYRNDKGEHNDYDEINKRRDAFNALARILKTTLYPELSPQTDIAFGINKLKYADNLYDIYKMINHCIHEYENIITAPQDRIYNVNSYYTKFGDLPDIKVKINEE